jgi:ribosome-binding factor A
MVSRRQERVAEMLREELSLLISVGLSDPRLEDAMVNVTDVRVSPDLRAARVYIEHVLPAESTRQVLSALQHAASFLRQALLTNLNLRFVPELHFAVDTTEQRARHIDEILDSIVTAQPAHPFEDPDADAQSSAANAAGPAAG